MKRTDGEPHDRLTRITAAMTDAMEAHPEYRDGDRAIVLLDDGSRGGIVLHGYDDGIQAFVDLMTHAKVLGQAYGQTVRVIPVDLIGEG